MKFVVYILTIVVALSFDPSLNAQDKSVDAKSKQGEQEADETLSFAVDMQVQEGTHQIAPLLVQEYLRVPVLVDLNFGKYASSDGEYLAQSSEELQTYYDLGMTYKYIAEPYYRKQLQLPPEQGIIVLTAAESGAGYKNGFRNGDLVLQIDETAVDTQYDLVQALSNERGEQRAARIRRDGQPMELVVLLSEVQAKTPTRLIIGVSVDGIDDLMKTQLDVEGGVAVTSLTADGPAKNVGVLQHDIITHINGQLINNLDDLKKIVENSEGKPVTLDLVRAAKKITVSVTPQEIPVEQAANYSWNVPLVNHRFVTEYPRTDFRIANIEFQTAESQPERTVEERLDEILDLFQRLETQIEDLKGVIKK